MSHCYFQGLAQSTSDHLACRKAPLFPEGKSNTNMISSRICFFFTPTHWMHYCFWQIWHWPCYIIGQGCLISPLGTHRKENDNCHSALSVPSLQITWFLLRFLGPHFITLSFLWSELISVTTVFHFALRHIQHPANISIPSFPSFPLLWKCL